MKNNLSWQRVKNYNPDYLKYYQTGFNLAEYYNRLFKIKITSSAKTARSLLPDKIQAEYNILKNNFEQTYKNYEIETARGQNTLSVQ